MQNNIFIFEDDIGVLEKIVAQLKDLGCNNIITATSKKQAFRALTESISNIVTIDIANPNFSEVGSQIVNLANRKIYFAGEEQETSLIGDHIYILKKGSYYKVSVSEILFVKADKGCITIKTLRETFTISSTIKSFAQQLNSPSFILIHRSFYINICHMISFSKEHVTIEKNNRLPLSTSGYDRLIRSIKRLKTKG